MEQYVLKQIIQVYSRFVRNLIEVKEEDISTYKCPYCRSTNDTNKIMRLKEMNRNVVYVQIIIYLFIPKVPTLCFMRRMFY